MITRTQILQRCGQIMDTYKFEPKNNDTTDRIATEVNEYFKTLGDEWNISFQVYYVDVYAFVAMVLIRYKNERFTGAETIFVEEPTEVCGTSDDYARAMGIIE